MNVAAAKDFRSKDFLLSHIRSILDFYQPGVSDTHWGGYHQNFKDDGSVYKPGFKHLVSSTRFIINYCKAWQYWQEPQHLQFLDRAYQLAKTLTIDLAAKADGLIWEHYTDTLAIDWEYNRNDRKNLYRPWGFQPGHQTEWAKLLIILHRFRPEDWMLERARFLFNKALAKCWDKTYGGILYGFSPDGEICDDDKYFWVQAESLAAAALLATETGDEKYWQWYDSIWRYAWQNMIDHQHGAWYRLLSRNNQKYSDEKSTAGGKCDYHTMGACWEVVNHAI